MEVPLSVTIHRKVTVVIITFPRYSITYAAQEQILQGMLSSFTFLWKCLHLSHREISEINDNLSRTCPRLLGGELPIWSPSLPESDILVTVDIKEISLVLIN